MEKRDINGFLLLDKPAGMTSNRALQTVKHLFRAKKAGFLGTLDPFATGMLPICFGKATKQVESLHQHLKTYRAIIQLGQKTTTGDPEGEMSESLPIPILSATEINLQMQQFVGDIEQIPPVYSAIKRGGVPLYKLARQGVVVERVARPVHIAALSLIGFSKEQLEFEVISGKGVYVRVLAEDLANRLGTCGHLIALRRLACGGFDGQKMYSLDELNALALQESSLLENALLPIAGSHASVPNT